MRATTAEREAEIPFPLRRFKNHAATAELELRFRKPEFREARRD
jgi:hypothetical protein